MVNRAIATVERSGVPGVEKAVAAIKADWPKVDEEWGRVEALAKKAKAERDGAVVAQWFRDRVDLRRRHGPHVASHRQ